MGNNEELIFYGIIIFWAVLFIIIPLIGNKIKSFDLTLFLICGLIGKTQYEKKAKITTDVTKEEYMNKAKSYQVIIGLLTLGYAGMLMLNNWNALLGMIIYIPIIFIGYAVVWHFLRRYKIAE